MHHPHTLEEAAETALREVEAELQAEHQAHTAGAASEERAEGADERLPPALPRQLSRTVSSSIQRTLALMQLDGTTEQILRANQDAPAGFRATSARRADYLRTRSAHWSAAGGRFYSAPPSVYSPSLHRYSSPGEDELSSRPGGTARSDMGVMIRPLSISADGTSAPSPRSTYTHATGSLPSPGAYSGFGSRSGGSGPRSRSVISGPGSNSGGGSRSSGSGSRGTHKTSSWGSRQLQHNPHSLTSTSVLEEPAEGVISMHPHLGVDHEDVGARFDTVLETVREASTGDHAESPHIEEGVTEEEPLVTEVPQLSPAPMPRRRANVLTLDPTASPWSPVESGIEEPPLVTPDSAASAQRTQSWLSVHSAENEAEGTLEEPDKPPPSELHVGGTQGLSVDLPPAPPVPELLPDNVTSPIQRTVTLSRLSRLARSTTFSSPEPGAAPAWADADAPRVPSGPQGSSCSAPATVTMEPPPVQSDAAGPSSLSAPSNVSSFGGHSLGTSSSSDAATHPPSPPAAAAAAAGDDPLAPSTIPSSEELNNNVSVPVVGGGPHRIMRLNPWAPLPGPYMAAVAPGPVQQLAVMKPRLNQDLLTAQDSLMHLRSADEIDAFRTAVTNARRAEEGVGKEEEGVAGGDAAAAGAPAASFAEQ